MSALLAFLATYWIHSTLLLGLAWIVTRFLCSGADGAAEGVWRSALVLSLCSPWATGLLSGASGRTPIALSLDQTGSALTAGGLELPWPALVLTLWFVLAARGVLRLVQAHRALIRASAIRRPLPSGLGRIPVSCSSGVEVPLVLRGEVCLPERALIELSHAELRAVIAHEAAHVERHDRAWRWLAVLSSRIFFFQPLNRLAAARLRELSECLCDDRAVAATGSGRALASALATVAGWVTSGSQSPAPAMAGTDSLIMRRVRRMLNPPGPRHAPLSHATWAAVAALLFAAITTLAPRVESAGGPRGPYTIHAKDPAGAFTLTIDRGRVIDATLDGRPVPRARLRQRGSRLDLIGEDASAFSLRLTARGGITWQPRARRSPPLTG
jgi:Zn-dependent protease with chaperone function